MLFWIQNRAVSHAYGAGVMWVIWVCLACNSGSSWWKSNQILWTGTTGNRKGLWSVYINSKTFWNSFPISVIIPSFVLFGGKIRKTLNLNNERKLENYRKFWFNLANSTRNRGKWNPINELMKFNLFNVWRMKLRLRN